MYLIAQDIFAQFYRGLFQFRHHSPFETCNQAFFHTLKQYGSTVGSKDKLFAVLMQMIEDVEERVLRFGNACKFLDIVNNQNVDCLVEVDEVVGRIVTYRVGVLYLE